MASRSGIRSYLAAASSSEQESLEEHKDIVAYIDQLDDLFRKLVTGKSYSRHPAAGFLGMNAHAAYLAAVSSALRGQFPPTFMILRGCIESALYSFLISLDKDEGDIWLKRREHPEIAKAKFNANRAIQKLEPCDPNLAAMAKGAYQWAIEFGAHPNPRSIIDHIRNNDSHPDEYAFSLIYIQSPESVAVIRCLSACVENGCMAAAVIRQSMLKHPEGDVTFEKVWQLFKSFQTYLSNKGYLTDTGAEGI